MTQGAEEKSINSIFSGMKGDITPISGILQIEQHTTQMIILKTKNKLLEIKIFDNKNLITVCKVGEIVKNGTKDQEVENSGGRKRVFFRNYDI